MAALIDKPEPETTTRTATDLKARLVDYLDVRKRPNHVLRVAQVTNHHFRVNTFAQTHDDSNVLDTYTIIKSQFLHVEDRNGELVVTDQTRR
jgi:hypothetical protein